MNVHIREDEAEAVRSRTQYVVDNLNNHPLCIREGITYVIVTERNHQALLTVNSPILRDEVGALTFKEYAVGDRLVSGVVPVNTPSNEELDYVGTLFFHLSRYEERELKQTDYLANKLAFERQLLLIREGKEKSPVVDDLIRAHIETLTKKKVALIPAQTLTHDIDFIHKFTSPFSIFRKVAGHFRHRKSASGLPKLWKTYREYLKGKDAYDTFDWMLSTKKMEKTIYFLRGGSHKEDNHYESSDVVFQKAIRLARERGYDFGIHPSYESWADVDMIRKQKERLENEVGEEIVRSRQHFLNFDIQKTPEVLQSLGIKEDSSLGYTRHVGYRSGTAYPYKLYDFKNEKAFDVVERPLVFMDVAWLFEAIRTGNYELPDLSKYVGCFNFHNSTFDEMGMRGIKMKGCYVDYFQES